MVLLAYCEKDLCGVMHELWQDPIKPQPEPYIARLVYMEDGCNNPTVLPPSSDSTVRDIEQKLSVLQGTSTFVSELQRRANVVDINPIERHQLPLKMDLAANRNIIIIGFALVGQMRDIWIHTYWAKVTYNPSE